MNAISLPRMLHSLPETLLLHNYGKASAPHFPLRAQLSTQLFSSWLPSSPNYLPVPSGALLFIPPCSPQIPMRLPRPEPLASSSSLSYFFLPCVQVIITAPSPLSALLEVCRPFSLYCLASAKASGRLTSLTTRRPSCSLVSTSGPWKFPSCCPGSPQPG